MNRKINTKAFTLIEILATVTILGILSVVAMVSVNSIIQNAKEKHYTNAEDQLELAGQSYVQQYRSALPKAIGQKVKIPMEKLVQTNYIEQIKDYSDNGCDMKNSYVQVFKYSQSDYSYVAYLDCPVYKSTEHLKEAAPNIVLTKKGDKMGETGDAQELVIEINPEGHEKTADKPAKLISYSYIVYKYDKEVKNSGSVALPNYDTRLNKTVDLTPYAPGKLKIIVTATNIYGLTTSKTITTDYKDTKGPTCIIDDVDKASNPKAWGKNPVKITVGCTDENGSGCTREEYTKTFKNSTETGIITIEDLAGNKTKCEVSVNIDITPPTVPTVKVGLWANNATQPTTATGLTAYTNNTWTNKNLFTEASATDANSGLKHYQYVLTGKEGTETNTISSTRAITTEGTSTIKYRACDNLDNCSEYSAVQTIKLDKTAPSIPTIALLKWSDNSTTPTSTTGLASYTSGAWSNLNIYAVPTSPEEGDDTSKIKEYRYTTTGATTNNTNKASATRNIKAEGSSTIKYRTCDNAGNCSDYSSTYTIKLDKTKPPVPTVKYYFWSDNSTTPTSASGLTEYTNSNWMNKNIYSVASGSTDPCTTDVCSQLKEYQYVLTGKEGTETNTAASSRNITTEGTSTIKYRACDNARNCSNYTTVKTIKLDKTKPAVPTVTLVKWSDNNTQPTSATGLTSYTNNTWSNKKIYTTASSTEEGDDTSKIKEYQYTTTGATTNATNSANSSRSIAANGTSTIKYRTCDNAGNCSNYSSTYTINIDKTKPVITFTTTPGTYNDSSGLTISSSCEDATSGVASQTGSSTLSSPSCNSSVTHTCTDNAGNTVSITDTFSVKKYSASSWCGVYEYNTCEAEGCGVASYKTCTAEICGIKTCATSACGTFKHTVPRGQSLNTASCPGYQLITSTSYGDEYSCYSTCQHYDCGLEECSIPACGVESYNSCQDPDCGAKSYNSCWHC